MHIFQNLKTPEQFRLAEEIAIAKKRGVSLEEYRVIKKKEYEEECQRIHMEELQSLGITEVEHQKREKKRKQKEKYREYTERLIVGISVPLVLFLLYYGIPSFLSSYETGKNVFLIVGIVFVLGLVVFYLCIPVFLTLWAFVDRVRSKRYFKVIIALVITLLVAGLILYIIGSTGISSSEIHEPVKLRPDRF